MNRKRDVVLTYRQVMSIKTLLWAGLEPPTLPAGSSYPVFYGSGRYREIPWPDDTTGQMTATHSLYIRKAKDSGDFDMLLIFLREAQEYYRGMERILRDLFPTYEDQD